jgi:hypothetical protein
MPTSVRAKARFVISGAWKPHSPADKVERGNTDTLGSICVNNKQFAQIMQFTQLSAICADAGMIYGQEKPHSQARKRGFPGIILDLFGSYDR